MASAVAWAWDTIARGWLVARTWLALRRGVQLSRIAGIHDPAGFVQAALVATGRSVALALAFLPRPRRAEASITFVACKVLHALDGLSPSRGLARARITAAIAYLAGEVSAPPRIHVRASQRLDALLASRLPLLRAALDGLPGDAARRCCDTIEWIGDAIVRGREGRQPVEQVHIEAVTRAVRLAAPAVRPPLGACRAAGRALLLVGELRAAPVGPARERVLERAWPSLAVVPRLLRWFPGSIGPGTRAALILLTTSLVPFSRLGAATPRRLGPSLRGALAVACSRRAYVARIVAMEQVLREAQPAPRPAALATAPTLLRELA